MSVKTEEINTISDIYEQADDGGNVNIQLGYEKGTFKYFLICERYQEKAWEEGFNLREFIENHKNGVEAVLNTGDAYSEENFVIRRMEEVAAVNGVTGVTNGKRPYMCEILAVEKQEDDYIVHTQNDGNNSVVLKAVFVCEDRLIEELIKIGFLKKEYKTSKGITLSRQNAYDGYKDGAVEYSADGEHTWIPLTAKCIGEELIINTSNKIKFRVYDKYKNLFDIREVQHRI